ncbi:hypothetical protein AAC03nite_20090 [Alicyclobacillus acidoterrestris]|nr:hypothetical protein AAC03nite_20090 [Alicyclobacillus acidoterrestris]
MDFCLAQGSTRYYFPMNPEQIQVQIGPKVETHTIISLGDVSAPRGRQLRVYSWQGILPGAGRKNQPYVKHWTDPQTFHGLLRDWANSGTSLQLIITGTGINITVFISQYTPSWSGGMGDISYSIEFTERRQIIVNTSSSSSSSTTSSTSSKTTSRPKPQTPQTYTVVKGDTLWTIAKKFSGSGANENDLYALNKSVIGADPDLIKPGMVLRLPAGW